MTADNYNHFFDLIRNRSSTRDFLPEPIPPEVLDAILEDALQSPSWSNTQPYRFAIAQGQVRDALADELKQKYLSISDLQRAPKWKQVWHWMFNKTLRDTDFKVAFKYPPELQARRLVTAKGLYGLLGIERHDLEKRDQQMAKNFEFFGAPTAIFLFVHQGLGSYSVLDAGIFLQSLMLAAQSRGVASCAQGALAQWRSPLDKHFDIPQDYKLICGVSLGYASDASVNSFRPARLAVEELKIKAKD